MRLLLACIEELTWPMEAAPPPFLAECLQNAATGPLSGFPPLEHAWLVEGEPFWPRLAAQGLRLGLMNLPGLWPPQALPGFMVCRRPSGDRRTDWTHPAQLSRDMGDYPQPQALPPNAGAWREALRDTAFAQAAALARLRYEHFQRLCAQWRVEVGALGWSALATSRQLFGVASRRMDLMLAQLDAYLSWLRDRFQPQDLAMAVLGAEDRPGFLAVMAPGLVQPQTLEPVQWSRLLAVLADLAQGKPLAPGWEREPSPEASP